MKYKYHSKTSGIFDYGLHLCEALKDDPISEKLLSLKRKWDADGYMNDWNTYEDEKKNRKVDVHMLICSFKLKKMGWVLTKQISNNRKKSRK